MNNLESIKTTLELLKNNIIIAYFDGDLNSPDMMDAKVRFIAETLKEAAAALDKISPIDRMPLLPIADGDVEITTIDRMVYVVLYELDRTGEALPMRDICEMVSCSETSFVQSVKKLEALGYIKKEPNNGMGHGRNAYRIVK